MRFLVSSAPSTHSAASVRSGLTGTPSAVRSWVSSICALPSMTAAPSDLRGWRQSRGAPRSSISPGACRTHTTVSSEPTSSRHSCGLTLSRATSRRHGQPGPALFARGSRRTRVSCDRLAVPQELQAGRTPRTGCSARQTRGPCNTHGTGFGRGLHRPFSLRVINTSPRPQNPRTHESTKRNDLWHGASVTFCSSKSTPASTTTDSPSTWLRRARRT